MGVLLLTFTYAFRDTALDYTFSLVNCVNHMFKLKQVA